MQFQVWRPGSPLPHPGPPLRKGIMSTLSTSDVFSTLSRVNAGEAAGPEGIPDWVFRACTEQLTQVFMDIFNLSLSQAVVLTCFKTMTMTFPSEILPVLNTRTVSVHLLPQQTNITMALHSALIHLDKNSYMKLPFVRFNSTFNTINPSRTLEPSGIGHWTTRVESVRFGNHKCSCYLFMAHTP